MAPDCGRVNHHAEPGWRDLPATRPPGPKSRSAAGLRLVFPAGSLRGEAPGAVCHCEPSWAAGLIGPAASLSAGSLPRCEGTADSSQSRLSGGRLRSSLG